MDGLEGVADWTREMFQFGSVSGELHQSVLPLFTE